MSNIITDWREATVAHLAGRFPDADVVSGRRPQNTAAPSVNRGDRDLIAVFWPGWQEAPRDIALAQPTLTIRYWPRRSKQPTENAPADPSVLEQAAADLMVAMRDVRKVGDLVDQLGCHVSRVVPFDAPEDWYVEATLEATTFHLATSAA